MPVPLRAHKADRVEAKYNVVTEYANFDLHSAAAAGNTGLVEYALSRGQPINSVLDGVLPLHAACAGGDEHVVRLLIDRGGDVNAPRLPRRISADKGRETTPATLFQRPGRKLVVGTTGDTPLHFAAANGNKSVIDVLLRKGAHPDRADKYGVTPEMLARQNGWVECADMLKAWIENKDSDLRERGTFPLPEDEPSYPSVSRTRGGSFGRESIDGNNPTPRRLQVKRSIDTALNMLKVTSSSSNLSDVASRPHPITSQSSLSPPSSPNRSRHGSTSQQPGEHTSPANFVDINSRRPSLPFATHTGQSSTGSIPCTFKRPRSAGSDTGTPSGDSVESRSRGKALSGKSSFMSLFKKAQTTDGTPPDNATFRQDSGSSLPLSAAITTSPKQETLGLPSDEGYSSSSFIRSFRHRMGSDASSSRVNAPSVSGQLNNTASSSSLRALAQAPSRPSVTELHSRLGNSRSSTTTDDPGYSSTPSRPSILRVHNRTSSSGQQGEKTSSTRALRFDPAPASRAHTSEESRAIDPRDEIGDSILIAPPTPVNATHEGDDDYEEEESYGRILDTNGNRPRIRSRNRGLSIVSSDSSLSGNSEAVSSNFLSADFPFSIQRPPTDTELSGRGRGNSLSSLASSDSQYNPNLSTSGTTSVSSRGTCGINTPIASPHREPYVETNEYLPHTDEPSRLSEEYDRDELDLAASHAHAEQMVQRTQKDILDMANDPTGGALSSSPGLSLSARLALYGESLELERKLRQQKEEAGSLRSGTPPVSPMKNSTPVTPLEDDDNRPNVYRHGSLDKSAPTRRYKQPRRPRTAEDNVNNNTMSSARNFISQHDSLPQSHSLDYDSVYASPHSPSGLRQEHSFRSYVDQDLRGPPDPDTPHSEAVSRASSVHGSFNSDSEYGQPLSRVSTIPANMTRKQREQAITTKLTKMGIPNEAAGRSATGNINVSSKRFGGLRSFVHNLKGTGKP